MTGREGSVFSIGVLMESSFDDVMGILSVAFLTAVTECLMETT